MRRGTKNRTILAAILWLFLLLFVAAENKNIINQIKSVPVIFAENTSIKTYSLGGYQWTDTRASAAPCNSYCKTAGYSGGTVTSSGTKTCAGATCAYISDFGTGTVSQVPNDGNCGCNSQFSCSCSGTTSTSTSTVPATSTLPAWDVSVKFDRAYQGAFYPFSATAGTLGTVYYANLNQDDNLYKLTPYNQTCPSYWPYDPVSTRAVGWYTERKKVTDNKYRLLVRGTAPADCNYGGSGAAKGELNLSPSGDWRITQVVSCSTQLSNRGQDVYCQTGEKYVKFAAGSNCGGCCACADSGSVTIELVVEKTPNLCGNGTCDAGETETSCAADCYVPPSKPDLVVSSITVEPSNPTTNDQVCLNATIKNTGTEAIDANDLTAWTYVNGNHISNTFYGKTLAVGEELNKQLFCSKYGENTSFKIGENSVKVVIDPAEVGVVDELDESNNENTASFPISEAPVTDWDVSIKFDAAHQGSFYPFSAIAGTEGTAYYAKLNFSDSLYKLTPYKETCNSGYYTSDATSTRAVGWFAERERITDTKYKLKVRGTAPADCNYSGPGATKGELDLNPSGDWKITQVTNCSAQLSNKGQEVYCQTGEKYVKFSAGSNCGGCCACSDSGNINIEVIVEKNPPEPLPTCVRANPSLSILPASQSGYAGSLGRYEYDVKLTNNDSTACEANVFKRWGSTNIASGATVTDSYTGNELPSVAPGESLDYKIYATVQPTVPPAIYQVSILAENDADGKIYSASKVAALELKKVPEPPTCADSDNGIDYFSKGTLDVTANDITSAYLDSCSPDGNRLTEWYCSGTEAAESVYECPNGCLDGACIEDKSEKMRVEVISPNGGESYKAGEKMVINFSNPITAMTKITVTNLKDPEYDLGEIAGTWTEWVIPADIKADKYKVSAEAVGADGALGQAKDRSDNFFDIAEKASENCLPDGTLVRPENDLKVYVIKNCRKQWIQTEEKFNDLKLDWSDVKTDITKEAVDSYVEYVPPVVIKAENDYKVYEVIDDKKLWIPTISSFQEQGLSWSEVKNTDDSTVSQYQDIKLLQPENSSKIYFITENGYKKQIPNADILKEYTDKWGDATIVSKDIINSIPETKLVKEESGEKVYRIYGSTKRWIKSEEVFKNYNYDWSQVVPVSATELEAYTDRDAIE